MSGGEHIILVPGLFGFSSIAGIDYFAEAAKILSRACEIPLANIETLPTPPTGSFWRRVDTLHACVQKMVRAEAAKIHLVGHSTGGVDVRLLTNSRYLWPGGPEGRARTAFFDRVGAVISISAPHQGTPIARRFRGKMESSIPFLFGISVLAKLGTGFLSHLKNLELEAALAVALTTDSDKPLNMRMLRAAAGGAGAELADFLAQIVEDHPLIHELTPFAMGKLNAKLEGADDQLEVTNFVTVAPPPSVHAADFKIGQLVAPIQRVLYFASFEGARLEPDEFGQLPDAPWIGIPENLDRFRHVAQDGVVPAASQTHDGHAAALIYGDHLDVVGHYVGAAHGGETVFDSGANFDDARMEATWKAVGAAIRAKRNAPSDRQ